MAVPIRYALPPACLVRKWNCCPSPTAPFDPLVGSAVGFRGSAFDHGACASDARLPVLLTPRLILTRLRNNELVHVSGCTVCRRYGDAWIQSVVEHGSLQHNSHFSNALRSLIRHRLVGKASPRMAIRLCPTPRSLVTRFASNRVFTSWKNQVVSFI